MGESECTGHEACPKCGSRDNLARYSDGHAYCFSLGCEHYEPATDGSQDNDAPRRSNKVAKGLIPLDEIEYKALPKRKLTETTTQKWRYGVAQYKGKTVQVANYCDEDGTVVAQKIRGANKKFVVTGDLKQALPLFGQHLWKEGGKKVVITEGELDALSVSQLQQNKWPVVSIPNGCAGAAKAISKAVNWLNKFDEVVFMFDNDEPGLEAAKQCAALLPPGKSKLAKLPLKDASEMLVEGRGGEVIDAMWNAREFRPDGLVTLGDLKEEVKKPIERGMDWPWADLTEYTYGRRLGEVYMLGAGTGVGKTDVFTQCVAHDVTELNEPVGLFWFEQMPTETLLRVAGKVAGKRFHIPDAGWTEEELDTTLEQLESGGRITLYNHWGGADWEIVKEHIRYLALQGVKLFYVDHLTALAAGDEDDERIALERIMAEVASLAQELKIIIHMISHLATPEGKPHEEGGRVMIRHFKGSRAIGFWSHFMFGLERDQQADTEEERKTTTLRILKDRYTGKATGKTVPLIYDEETGILSAGVHKTYSDEMSTDESDMSRSDF